MQPHAGGAAWPNVGQAAHSAGHTRTQQQEAVRVPGKMKGQGCGGVTGGGRVSRVVLAAAGVRSRWGERQGSRGQRG